MGKKKTILVEYNGYLLYKSRHEYLVLAERTVGDNITVPKFESLNEFIDVVTNILQMVKKQRKEVEM